MSTKHMSDGDLMGISGGGAFEHLFSRVARGIRVRLRGGAAATPSPGGPGPGPEAQGDSSGLNNLSE